MVELKFKDIESLNAVTGALYKNGYEYSTFIVWKKDNGGIYYFTVQIEGVERTQNFHNKHLFSEAKMYYHQLKHY